MKIINFYKNLQDREKKLLSISLLLIITLILFFIFSSVYKNYTRSSLNLEKAKSDYEYVYSKVHRAQSSLDKKVLDINVIKKLISKNNLDSKINDLQISSVDSYISITFFSLNYNDAVLISELIINNSQNKITNIKFQKIENKINTQLTFN
tara:strand:+ start:1253 stop:1705 length:453 start_codon:yes stop_codon:yes gene_type:complete